MSSETSRGAKDADIDRSWTIYYAGEPALILDQNGDEGLSLRYPTTKKGDGLAIGGCAKDLLVALTEAVEVESRE